MSTNLFLSPFVEKAVYRFLEDLGSSRALSVEILMRYQEWDQLSTLEVDPRHYIDAESYWYDASAISILRKLKELPTTVDRKVAAEETFLECERSCLVSNRRLFPLTEGRSSPLPSGVHDYFARVRKIIFDILGPCPDILDGRFGPGTTFADRGRFSTIPDKMTSEPLFTTDAWPLLFQWSGTLWAKAVASSGRLPKSIPGNRFLTVPKDCKKDRGIAVEPSINVFYQLGVGQVIRRRLSRSGINLNEGQDIHRRLAREASSAGHLATLDLSNASDTICRNLVRLLLPPRWFSLLDLLRSKKTLFREEWHLLEKFSSMGNGFTFELETLIFLALTVACYEDGEKLIGSQILAFGDDIICPTKGVERVIAVLSFCGLTVNREKSSVDGPFRESCGGDYFNGVDVRPFFLKESPSEPQHLIAFANGLRRAANSSISRDFIVNRAWLSALDGLPVEIRRLRGPKDLGDVVIHDEDTSRWKTQWRRNGIRYVRIFRPARFRKVSWRHFESDVILAAAVYGMPWGNGEFIPRDSVSGYKIGWAAFS